MLNRKNVSSSQIISWKQRSPEARCGVFQWKMYPQRSLDDAVETRGLW